MKKKLCKEIRKVDKSFETIQKRLSEILIVSIIVVFMLSLYHFNSTDQNILYKYSDSCYFESQSDGLPYFMETCTIISIKSLFGIIVNFILSLMITGGYLCVYLTFFDWLGLIELDEVTK